MKRKHSECDEEETNTDTKEVCSSPTSSRSSVSHESIEVNVPAEVEVKAIDLNFDFGFDAERDAHLIATNFNQQFSNDDVSFLPTFKYKFAYLGAQKVLVSTLSFVFKAQRRNFDGS